MAPNTAGRLADSRSGQAPARQHGISRRAVLSYASAGAVGLAAATWLHEQPYTRELLQVLLTAATTPHSPLADAPDGYFHACFSVRQPADVARAAALGINFVICYGSASQQSVDPESPLGRALTRYSMRAFLDIQSAALSCQGGTGQVDTAAVSALVGRFARSPLLAGYWTKDDDCGNEGLAVQQLASLIRSVDPDRRHLIMPGYGNAASLARNYRHGQADVLGFYPYPAAGRGPAHEVPGMLRIVLARTPAGAAPPPFIGIYQVFGSPPHTARPSVQEVVDQVAAYRSLGAVGVAGWAWDTQTVSHHPSNDATLRQAIAAVTQWLIAGPGRTYHQGVRAG